MTRRFDPLALVAGLVFIAIAVIGLTDRIQLSINDVRWIAPILLVLFGVLLLVTAANGNRRADAGDRDDDVAREPSIVGGGALASDEVPDAQAADAQPEGQPGAADAPAPQPPTEDR